MRIRRQKTQTVQDNGRMQMGYQMTNLRTFKPGSFLYEKVVELVGALHISSTTKVHEGQEM